jgi:uncharacterized protein YxjI
VAGCWFVVVPRLKVLSAKNHHEPATSNQQQPTLVRPVLHPLRMARYKMRQKLISLGEDFTIEDAAGNPAFEVDGKVMTLRETFELKDRQGNVVATIRSKLLSVRSKMDVLRDGDVVATITKAFFAPLRQNFKVDIPGGKDLDVDGSILDHEYTLRRGDDVVGQVSKRWFTFTDTYGIEVAEGEDDALVLAIAVALDEMAHDKEE